jgi:hypothetical protein
VRGKQLIKNYFTTYESSKYTSKKHVSKNSKHTGSGEIPEIGAGLLL